MKKLLAFFLITSVFVSCTDKKKKEETPAVETETVIESTESVETTTEVVEETTETTESTEATEVVAEEVVEETVKY